jgi:uncharacterized protein (DUF1684 family)
MAQIDSVSISEILHFRTELNQSYQDSVESPLSKVDLAQFSALDFYPVDLSFRVKAKLTRDTSSSSFAMKTSTTRQPKYRKFGDLAFVIHQKKFCIPVYQNVELSLKPGFENYLFFPFTDLTNLDQTYGGGRYLDLKIPEGDTLVLDFNQCYQPYCAYNHKYSCPIPPPENFIDLRIEAGVKGSFYKKE